jgi:glycosyltransferase involved in cell wall biosynthesis
MLKEKKIAVVMPAYNAAKTLQKTYIELPHDIIDEVILVDDNSYDNTAELARKIGIKHVIEHDSNLGYGGNQKTCYNYALELGADIIVMIHPDYQYTPKLCTSMAALIAEDVYDCVLGSRILGTGALRGGMPLYKYVANRALTAFQNIFLSHKLSEYHTGYRAFSAKLLKNLPLHLNSNNFLFDNQMLTQIIYGNYDIGEITCPTKYMDDASSINLRNSVIYGIGVIKTSIEFKLNKLGLTKSDRFFQVQPKAK